MGKVLALPNESAWAVPTLPEFLTAAEKDRRWLVPGLILDSGIILMSGHKKRARKTMTAFGAALSLATGAPFGPWKPIAPAPVVVIEEEGPAGTTRERLAALCASMGIEPPGNVRFAHHHGVKLDKPEWRRRLLSIIKETAAKLMVLDAIVYMHNANENSVPEMSPVVDTVRTITANGCAVMMLAHLDKTRGSDPTADPDDQVRGTGLLTDCYDEHIILRRYKESDPEVSMAIRWRDGGDGDRYALKWSFDSDPVTGALERADLKVGDPKAELRAKMEEYKKAILSGQSYTITRLQSVWGVDNMARAKSILAAMLEDGYMVRAKEKGSYVRA